MTAADTQAEDEAASLDIIVESIGVSAPRRPEALARISLIVETVTRHRQHEATHTATSDRDAFERIERASRELAGALSALSPEGRFKLATELPGLSALDRLAIEERHGLSDLQAASARIHSAATRAAAVPVPRGRREQRAKRLAAELCADFLADFAPPDTRVSSDAAGAFVTLLEAVFALIYGSPAGAIDTAKAHLKGTQGNGD